VLQVAGCSSFLIFVLNFTWPKQRTAEQQNFELQNFEGSFPSTFDIPYSIFDIRFPKVSYSIKLAAPAASG